MTDKLNGTEIQYLWPYRYQVLIGRLWFIGAKGRLLFGRKATENSRTKAWRVNMLGICCPRCSTALRQEGKLSVGLFKGILSCRPYNDDTTMYWKLCGRIGLWHNLRHMIPSDYFYECEERQRKRPMARDMNSCAVNKRCTATLANSSTATLANSSTVTFANSCTATLANSSIVTIANSSEVPCLEIRALSLSLIGSLSEAAVAGCSGRCRLYMR